MSAIFLTYKAAAVAAALIGFAIALRAAFLWLKASNVYPTTPAASISDVPELHLMATQSAMYEASLLNARAAKWTASAAVAGALSSVFGAL